MSGRPDFLERRKNFDARETFCAAFDRFNKNKQYCRLWPVYRVITSRALFSPHSYKATLRFIKVDRITHSRDIFIRNFWRWRAVAFWIWRKQIHLIRRPKKNLTYTGTKHEVDRMTCCGDIANFSVPMCISAILNTLGSTDPEGWE